MNNSYGGIFFNLIFSSMFEKYLIFVKISLAFSKSSGINKEIPRSGFSTRPQAGRQVSERHAHPGALEGASVTQQINPSNGQGEHPDWEG